MTHRSAGAGPGWLHTALVATSDVHAVAAWQVLRERGLSVPDDMSVIGFDES